MSEPSDETTEPVAAVEETEPAAESVPAEPAPTADDPVRTVTRKGATVAIAGALVVGGLAGWVAGDVFGDDDGGVPISAFQEGGGRFHRWGGGQGFPGPGGGPWDGGGGFPGGPGGGWHDDGERPPWMDERPDDEGDDGDDDDRGTDEDQDQDDRESPSTTTEGDA